MNSSLLITKSDFNSSIDERILIGKTLFNQEIKSEEQLNNLKNDFSDWSDFNIEFLKQAFDSPTNEYKIEYEESGRYIGLYSMDFSLAQELKELKDRINSKINKLRQLRNKSGLFKTVNIESKINADKKVKYNNKQVFIVHGHDQTAKTKAARFIEKLDLEPIILHEQASGSRTIIEKIEAYSNVAFGIILYTPCDIGAKKTESPMYKNRARQNVVFEHGFLIGKIGRNNVCALVKDNVETPNDISGVVYIQMDENDGWQLKVAKEIKSSGFDIDLNKL